MRTFGRWSSLALVMLLAAAGNARAQAQSCEIFGRATDSSGAVMPGVTVTASSPALITPQTTTTTSTGAYRFPNIPIGVYNVTFPQSVSGCAVLASVSGAGMTPEEGFAAASPGTQATQINVQTFDKDGVHADRTFAIAAFC